MQSFFQDYDVQMLIGLGSSGAVFYALRDNKAYAIKIIVGERNVRTQVEFRSEAEAQQAMDHPNIVKIYDYGEIENFPFIIMDYVERGTLFNVLSEYKFDQTSVANLSIMICEGLQYAHEKHYVHRDMKPDNIMISGDWTPKIMDFGLAVNLDAPNYRYTAVGSKGYAAPEVITHPKEIDYRVDVYAMGGIIYNMLTREIPHATAPDFEKLRGHDPRFKVLVKNAMNPDVEKRTESVAAVKSKLLNMMKSWENRG